MKKWGLMMLILLIINSCQKAIVAPQEGEDDHIKTLISILVYGEEEEVRINALNALTKKDARYSAINELIIASETKPELFPRDISGENQSLLKEIITTPVIDTKEQKEKDYIEERKVHLRMLNRLLKLTMGYRMYYEVATILHQKYLYGTLWSQEIIALYNNKPSATEFVHARNAAIANLQLLLTIVKEERTRSYIEKCLKETTEPS